MARHWRIRGPSAKPLKGAFSLPGDKSISHRCLLFAALAEGTSRLENLATGGDVRSTRRCLEALGVRVSDAGVGSVEVFGRGLDGWSPPSAPLDCGNSGTTARVLLGALVAQGFPSSLVGDASLSRRPMGRVTRPLRMRGARVEGVVDSERGDEVCPLDVRGLSAGASLSELEYALPVASAQVKSALLLSGLFADGPTLVREPMLSRDHTERLLAAMGCPVETVGPATRLDPTAWDRRLAPLAFRVPGDVSSAAFLVAAAHIVPGSKIRVRSVSTNPTRTGFLEALRDQGGHSVVEPKGEVGGEPVGDLFVHHGERVAMRRGMRVGGELALRCLDEFPALVAVAAVSPGESRFDDLGELRVKESDRIAAMAAVLVAFGIDHSETPDGMHIRPGAPRGGAVIDCRGDHRVAMAAAVLALAADGDTVVRDVGCVDTSFPGFAGLLRGLGGPVTEEED